MTPTLMGLRQMSHRDRSGVTPRALLSNVSMRTLLEDESQEEKRFVERRWLSEGEVLSFVLVTMLTAISHQLCEGMHVSLKE